MVLLSVEEDPFRPAEEPADSCVVAGLVPCVPVGPGGARRGLRVGGPKGGVSWCTLD